MTESRKEKKTCEYEWDDSQTRTTLKCGGTLFDDEYCVFHSKNRKEKEQQFMGEFSKLLVNEEKGFAGFIFPEKADLRLFNLQQADLQGADLRGVDLYMAILQGANLFDTKLQGASLFGANLDGAYLQGTDLRGTNLGNVSFEKAKVFNVKYNRSTQFLGIDVTRVQGSQSFVRFAKEEAYLQEMRTTAWGKVKYSFWNVLADCGRSIWVWILWSIFMAIGFAIKFFSLGPEAFKINEHLGHSFSTMLYYSVVTFTTLGFGDITPNTIEASRWVMAEVILGYVMLGGLISIFANKLARRS